MTDAYVEVELSELTIRMALFAGLIREVYELTPKGESVILGAAERAMRAYCRDAKEIGACYL